MSEYERGIRIQQAFQALKEEPDTVDGYLHWLRFVCPNLEQDLSPQDLNDFCVIKDRPSGHRVREDILVFLERLLEQREQDWLDHVYALSDGDDQDQNLTNFVDNWERHRKKLLVFLGAGASIGARRKDAQPLPNGTGLRNLIVQEFLKEQRPDGLTLEFAAALAQEKAGKKNLCEFVEEIFQGAKPLWQHATLPFLMPRAVFTTNYDNLVEDAWDLHAREDSFDPCENVFSMNTRSWRNKVPVFKPHGSIGSINEKIGEGGLVLTQFDYFEMISNNQDLVNYFLNDFENNCVLFIGYSMMDMDIGSQLWSKRRKDTDVNWYAVFPCDGQTREMYNRELGLRVINRKFHQFMKELDDNVDFIPKGWKFEEIQNLREKNYIG